MKKSPFLLSLLALALLAIPSSAARTGHAVYRPGLTQARIPLGSPMGYVTAYTGVPALASNLLATADASWLDRTLDVFKDGEHANDATNPVSGKTWPWLVENRHGVFAYEGEIFVDGEALPHGWYGSSESDAQFVDDVHFEGPGMIHAGNFPTMMILR